MSDENYNKALAEAKHVLATAADEMQKLADWYRTEEAARSVVDKYQSDGAVGWVAPYRWAYTDLLQNAHAKGIDIAYFIPSATLGFITERHMTDDQEKAVLALFAERFSF